jgi:hypothetical protein
MDRRVSTKCSIIDSKESIYLVGILTQLRVLPNTRGAGWSDPLATFVVHLRASSWTYMIHSVSINRMLTCIYCVRGNFHPRDPRTFV